MLLVIPTIIHSCSGGCDDEDINGISSVKFDMRVGNNNNRDNKDLAKSHTVIPTSHPFDYVVIQTSQE